MDRGGDLIHLMPNPLACNSIISSITLTYLRPTSCFSPSCKRIPAEKDSFSFISFVLDSITATRVQSPRVSLTFVEDDIPNVSLPRISIRFHL